MEEQEVFVVLCEGYVDDWYGVGQQQFGIGFVWIEVVVYGVDDEVYQDGYGYGGDVDVGDLVGGEVEFIFDDWYQWCVGELGEEVDEEGYLGQMEGVYLGCVQGEQCDMIGFVYVGFCKNKKVFV